MAYGLSVIQVPETHTILSQPVLSGAVFPGQTINGPAPNGPEQLATRSPIA